MTKDYRGRVKHLEKLALDLVLEIEEFPRDHKPGLLFHGVPQRGVENELVLQHAVTDIIAKTLGIRGEVTITQIVRLQAIE